MTFIEEEYADADEYQLDGDNVNSLFIAHADSLTTIMSLGFIPNAIKIFDTRSLTASPARAPSNGCVFKACLYEFNVESRKCIVIQMYQRF
ncbi:unnamed protein product [Rotaria sp. Silwood1]|nr:unnamed protein product [Rotaria sp. Silwood1]